MADSCWLLSAAEFVHRETKKKTIKGKIKARREKKMMLLSDWENED